MKTSFKGNLILSIAMVSIMVISAIALAPTASAQATPNPYCANNVSMTAAEFYAIQGTAAVTETWTIQNGQLTFHVTNNTGCAAPLVAAAYKMFINQPQPGWLATQQFFATSGVVNINPTGVTNIPVAIPSCMSQVDLFYGQAPQSFPSDTPSTIVGTYQVVNGTMVTGALCTVATPSPTPTPTPTPQCSDSVDNDGDGRTDSADPGCHTDGKANNPNSFDPNDNTESDNIPQCRDGIDNDNDGKTDLNDPGCDNADDNSEDTTKEQCRDNKDNDGDGKEDEADPGCHTDGDATDGDDTFDPNDNNEENGQCSDNKDNDNDGLIDRKDPDCHTDGKVSNASSFNGNLQEDTNNRHAVKGATVKVTPVAVPVTARTGAGMVGVTSLLLSGVSYLFINRRGI